MKNELLSKKHFEFLDKKFESTKLGGKPYIKCVNFI